MNKGRFKKGDHPSPATEFKKGMVVSPEMRRKIGEGHKGEKNYFFGKKHSLETRRKMSEAWKHRKGIPRSAECRRKISESRMGDKNPMKFRTGPLNPAYRHGQAKTKIGVALRAMKRRAQKRGNGGEFTVLQWEALKTAFRFTCPACGRSEPEVKLTPDHIVPICMGGKNDILNIQPLCLKCNMRKHDKTVIYLMPGETALDFAEQLNIFIPK